MLALKRILTLQEIFVIGAYSLLTIIIQYGERSEVNTDPSSFGKNTSNSRSSLWNRRGDCECVSHLVQKMNW